MFLDIVRFHAWPLALSIATLAWPLASTPSPSTKQRRWLFRIKLDNVTDRRTNAFWKKEERERREKEERKKEV